MSRTVPITRLHRYYESLQRMNTEQQTRECRDLVQNPAPLVDLFLESRARFEEYCNVEGFGSSARKVLNPASPVGLLVDGGTIHVSGPAAPYSFQCVGREVNPWRTTASRFSDGKLATSSGGGGVDYLGRVVGEDRPILGEVKAGSDKTVFYAFVQLLNYLGKFATENQVERCNRFPVFGGSLPWPPRFDLHILLVDFNDRGSKQDTIGLTGELAAGFLDGVAAVDDRGFVGTVMCLRMETQNFEGTVSQIW